MTISRKLIAFRMSNSPKLLKYESTCAIKILLTSHHCILSQTMFRWCISKILSSFIPALVIDCCLKFYGCTAYFIPLKSNGRGKMLWKCVQSVPLTVSWEDEHCPLYTASLTSNSAGPPNGIEPSAEFCRCFFRKHRSKDISILR